MIYKVYCVFCKCSFNQLQDEHSVQENFGNKGFVREWCIHRKFIYVTIVRNEGEWKLNSVSTVASFSLAITEALELTMTEVTEGDCWTAGWVDICERETGPVKLVHYCYLYNTWKTWLILRCHLEGSQKKDINTEKPGIFSKWHQNQLHGTDSWADRNKVLWSTSSTDITFNKEILTTNECGRIIQLNWQCVDLAQICGQV